MSEPEYIYVTILVHNTSCQIQYWTCWTGSLLLNEEHPYLLFTDMWLFHSLSCSDRWPWFFVHTIPTVYPPHGQWPAPMGSWRVYLLKADWPWHEANQQGQIWNSPSRRALQIDGQTDKPTLPTLFYLATTQLMITGLVRFMGYGDLWVFKLTLLIFYKSRAAIYGDLYHPYAFHKSP